MHIDVVIRQMSERNKAERPELVFEKMDLLQMTYNDAAFDLVLDKGTCDALCTDASPETRERMKKMFAEVARFVCVCVCVCVCANCVYLRLYTPQPVYFKRLLNQVCRHLCGKHSPHIATFETMSCKLEQVVRKAPLLVCMY